MKSKKDLRIVMLHMTIVTICVLLVPLFAMQFLADVNWSSFDFIIAGILVAAASFIMDVVIRGTSKYKALISFMIIVGFVVIWAQLSVGVVTQFLDGTLFTRIAQSLGLW